MSNIFTCLICGITFLVNTHLFSFGQNNMHESHSAFIVMTYNIRYNNPDDGINSWSNRKEKLISVVQNEDPDIIGFQEALKDQIDDLSLVLKTYAWFGKGRDDGNEKGEYVVIFYKKDRFLKLDSGYFWLSETPEKSGSIGWDAACTRIVSWIKLKDIITGSELFHFNTHFDHEGQKARIESAKLLTDNIRNIAGNSSVILTGDFNCQDDSEAIGYLTNKGSTFHFSDSRKISKTKPSGPHFTYTGFEVGKIEGELIDYIFVRKINKVLSHKIIDKSFDGFYPSDHIPAVTYILL